MSRPRRRPERVDDALQHVLQRIDPERRLELFRVWATEVGDMVAAHAEPAGFRDGVLSVRGTGGTWMQELQFVKEEIRTRLNARLGSEVVRDVYFVSGGGESASAPRARTRAASPPDDADEPVDLPPMRDPRL